MARLPIPGSDDGKWGEILNQYLSVALDADGELRTDTVGRDQLRLNSVTSHAIADESVTSSKLAPGAVTAASVGLGNVDNTSDADKPVSNAMQAAINAKVTGPTSASNATVARFDGNTGKLIKDSLVFIDDNGRVGIGSTPDNALDIIGADPTLKITSTELSRSLIFNPKSGSLDSEGTAFHFNRYSGKSVAIGYSSAGHLRIGQAAEVGFASTALLYIANTETTTPALVLDKAPAQTADILQIRSNGATSGGDVFKVSSDGNIGIGALSPSAPLHVGAKSSGATNKSSVVVGDDLLANTGLDRAKLTLGNTSGIAEFIVGQTYNRSILFNWQYNADPALAYGNLETYGRNNPLRIGASTLVLQNAGGNIGIQTATPTHTLTLSSATTGIAHYNTSDMTTNYERVRQYWSGNTFNIVAEQGGSGLSRPIFVNGGNTSLTVGTTTPSSPGLRIIRSGTGVESLVQITSGGLTASSATQATLRLDPTINQSGTAGYTVLHVEASETALGSGAKLLADFKANGVSKFSISNTGAITSQQAINTQTGTSYTLTLSDAGQVVTLDNASAISVTVPLHATTAYPIGTRIDLLQLGVGQVTVVPSGGVTIRTASGLKFYGQYAGATLLKLATDTWIISGNLTL